MPSPATLPSWITIDGALGDLAAVLPELKTYADLAMHWRDIATAVWKLGQQAPVDDPVKLAVYVAGKIDDPAIVDIFHTLGLDQLRDDVKKVADRLTDPSAPWAKLLRPVSDFVPTTTAATGADGFGFDDGNKDGLLALTIPKLAGSAATDIGPAALKFDVGVQGGLTCEAGANWPFQRDGVAPGLLRIGGNGKVTTRVGLSLPFGQIGSGTAEAGASAEAAIGFFFRPADPARSYAEALFDAVTAIPEPLSLNDISHAMSLGGLEGLALGCDGAVDAGLGLVLGESFDIPSVASGTVGLTAELSFRRNARWILSLRKVDGGMRFVLSRDEARERHWAVGADLKLDAAPLARRVHDLLLKADDAAKPILAQIRPFLSPGTYIADHAGDLLKMAATSIIEQPDLRDALVADLSLALGSATADDSVLIGLLEKKIADLAATQTKGILADVEEWAGTVVNGLVAKVPGLAATGLADQLTARIKPLLTDVKGRFDQLLGQLTANAGVSAALAKELAAVGAMVKATETDADKLLAGVRQVVSQFDAFAQRVLDVTGDSAKAKLEARFGWSGDNASGLKYELMGTIAKDAAPEAAELWRSLVTGRMQPFQRILADPTLAPAGVTLSPDSSLSRFASVERGFSFEVVIFGIDVSITSIVTGKASITTDGSGTVLVAEGSALRKVEGFEEGRKASFVSGWDLALTKLGDGMSAKRTMSIGLGFDHDDKDLKAGEVEGLLSGLAAQKLIDSSRVQAAIAIYQGWKVAGAVDAKVKGRVSIRMTLPERAIERMVAIGRELGNPGPVMFGTFILAIKAQLAAGVTGQKQFDRDLKTAQDTFTISSHADDPMAYAIALWRSNIDLSSNDQGKSLPAMAQVIPRAGAFVKLLRTMALIYDAIPASGSAKPGGWSEKDYAAAEKDLAAASRGWLRLNQNFILWFKAELHPAMLAFMRLLALMTRPAIVGGSLIDGLDGDPDTAVSNQMLLIAMAQGKDDYPIPV